MKERRPGRHSLWRRPVLATGVPIAVPELPVPELPVVDVPVTGSTADRPSAAEPTAQGSVTSTQARDDVAHEQAGGSSLFGRGLLYVLVSGVQLVTSAISSPVLAHVLDDPAQLGYLASAISLHQLLIVLALVGLDQAVVLQAAERGIDRGVRSLASAAVLVACAATAVLWATAQWWAPAFGFPRGSPLVTITVLWTVPSAGVMVLLALLLAADRLRPYSIVSLLAAVGGQVVGVTLVLTHGRGATSYAWGLLAADAFAMAVAVALTRPRLRGALSWSRLRPALVFGAPLMLGSISVYVLNAGDRIILQRLAGAADVGRYQVAYTVGFVAVQLIGLTSTAWTPRFAAVRDAVARAALIGRSRDLLYGLLSPVVLGIVLAAPVALRVVAPVSFDPGTLLPVVFFVVVSAYPVAASGASGRILVTAWRTRPLALCTALAAGLNVALNFALVPWLGIAGAAAATLVAYAVQGTVQRLAVGGPAVWPRTPRRVLVEVVLVVLVAGGTVLLPQDTVWNTARFVLGLACLPWCWRRLQAARAS